MKMKPHRFKDYAFELRYDKTPSVTWPLYSPYAVSYRWSVVRSIWRNETWFRLFTQHNDELCTSILHGYGDIKPQTLIEYDPLMVAHAHIQLPFVLPRKVFLLYGTGKQCSKFGEDRSISDVTILSTDAGRTNGRLRDFIGCPMHMHSIGQAL